MCKPEIYENGLTGSLRAIPPDVAVTPSWCKKYTYRTPGGALVFQATRADHPDDTKGAYYGEWVDTTDEQYAKEHNGKTRRARSGQSKKPSEPDKDELAKAEALLALLKGGDK